MNEIRMCFFLKAFSSALRSGTSAVAFTPAIDFYLFLVMMMMIAKISWSGNPRLPGSPSECVFECYLSPSAHHLSTMSTARGGGGGGVTSTPSFFSDVVESWPSLAPGPPLHHY